MSIPRSILPLARPRFAFSRGTATQTHRGVLAQLGRTPNARLAIASTFGLSLAALYALSDTAHADAPPARDDAIRALRTHKSVESFSLDVLRDTEALLKRYEETHRPPAASGVLRYDVAQAASNNPLEDDHSEAFVTSKAGDAQRSFFAVLDGHSGWETSALLREELIPAVVAELARVDLGAAEDDGTDALSAAMRRAFTAVDDRIVHGSIDAVLAAKSRTAATNLLAPAYAGACALLAFYDAPSRVLRVALTGDCRAVLGRRRADGNFDLEVLTTDQTGDNPAERQRVEAAHPGETVVTAGRTMGFGPARVFGDARYKWSRALQERLRPLLGRNTPEAVQTPPYFTAEPVVTVVSVRPGDFVVLATDGLWECLTSREAVGLVGAWVQRREARRAPWGGRLARWWGGRAAAGDQLPVVSAGGTAGADDTVRYPYWRAEKKFVTVDDNVATHLVRNALGGADEDLRDALLSMRSPRSRTFWDDITATVVFFGESD